MSSVVVRREGELWWVGLNRPDRRNAHDEAMVAEFDAVLAEARRTPSILLVHSTTPGMFAAGADIREMRDRGSDHALRAINAGLFERLEAHRWPTIALVDGPRARRRLRDGARLRLPDRESAGRLRPAGTVTRHSRRCGRELEARTALVGLATARRMLYAGARLDATSALAAGAVDEIADDLPGRAAALAVTVAQRSWRALELTKLALRAHRPDTTHFDTAAQGLLFDSADKYERTTTFLERKKV